MWWGLAGIACIVIATLILYSSCEEDHVYWINVEKGSSLVYDWGEFRIKDSELLVLIPTPERQEAYTYLTSNFDIEYHNTVLTHVD